MIVLDTNIVSELMRRRPEPKVIDWLDRQVAESLWTTAVTVLELRMGIESVADTTRRSRLETEYSQVIELDLGGRIAPFDRGAGLLGGVMAAALRSSGRGIDIRDLQIGAIVSFRGAVLATRNTRHFQDLGIPLVDPWG